MRISNHLNDDNLKQAGFTLIELSIVLVIIGLITGGILVGRDLIHAAEIRSTIKTLQQYDTAVNTFRLKYNCLPGDCDQASSLGFSGIGIVNGNGNGQIEYINNESATEAWNATLELSQANLIVAMPVPNQTYSTVNVPLPVVGGTLSLDIFYYTAVPSISVQATGHYFQFWQSNLAGNSGATPADAYAIDSKIDDGLPRSGSVLATSAYTMSWEYTTGYTFYPATDTGPAGASSNFCITNDSPNLYNVQNTSQSPTSTCVFTVKANF